jgi:4-aminobutyrate aminotransferase
MPLAAVIARDDVMKWSSGGHGSTFGGNPVSCAAALATLDVIEDGLVDNAARVGGYLKRGLEDLQKRHPIIGDVRGLGLMLAIDLVKDRENREPAPEAQARVLVECFEKGLIFLGCGASAVRMATPLIVSEREVDPGLEILDEVLKQS